MPVIITFTAFLKSSGEEVTIQTWDLNEFFHAKESSVIVCYCKDDNGEMKAITCKKRDIKLIYPIQIGASG